MNYFILILGAVMFIGGAFGIIYQKPAEPCIWKYIEAFVEDGRLVICHNGKRVSPDWLVYSSGWTKGDWAGSFESYKLPDSIERQHRYNSGGTAVDLS